MYKAVAFDFGNVLSVLDRMSFAEAAAEHSPLPAAEIDALLWGGRLERDFETGVLDSRAYFREVQALVRLSPDYGYPRFCEDFKRIIVPHPDGEKGLVAARDLGARCFVLSNTSWLHACTIFDNEILATVPELHILSYKVGHMKPDPRIWLKLLEYSGLEARDCLYIDDIAAYCEQAAGLGFGAVQYDKKRDNLSQIVGNMLK